MGRLADTRNRQSLTRTAAIAFGDELVVRGPGRIVPRNLYILRWCCERGSAVPIPRDRYCRWLATLRRQHINAVAAVDGLMPAGQDSITC